MIHVVVPVLPVAADAKQVADIGLRYSIDAVHMHITVKIGRIGFLHTFTAGIQHIYPALASIPIFMSSSGRKR